MTLTTERSDLLRATVEGVARNLRWLAPSVRALCGSDATEVVFGGGAARSPGVAQVLADVLGLTVVVPDRPEMAAARAAGSVALSRTIGRDPAADTVVIAARHEPDPGAAAVHERLQPIFEAAFSANAPICQALGS